MANDEKLLSVSIDGSELEVPRGTTILQAAERVGVVIPRYCYHPGLSAPALCRMCLVEVEDAPKLLPACVQQVQDGMVVHTDSPDARKARRGVIEFLLLNHPLDCPICDAAGQCELQDYAFETGQTRTRLHEPKLVLGRDKVTAEIVYFADRCILCTRCVRFMDEIAQDSVLKVMQRGHRGYIDTMSGELFEHPFSMNIVDVCPVGALVNEDFLFKARAWDLDQTPSICPGCSQGCNISLGTKENRVLRAKPRPNSEVNSFWMCDHGRKVVINWGAGDRVEVPLLKQEDGLVACDWARMVSALAEALREAKGEARALVSAGASNENLYVLRKLMSIPGFGGGVFRVDTGPERTLKGFPQLALRPDRAPNVRGAELLGFERSDDPLGHLAAHSGPLFVLEDAGEDAPAELGRSASLLVYIGTHMSELARRAEIVIPTTTFAEMAGTFTNFTGRVQQFTPAVRPPSMARPLWLTGSAVLARLDAGPSFRTAGSAFAALAGEIEAFSGLTYEKIGFYGREVSGAASGMAATSS
jgi:NADH-quinone oxidoreductase subunit G